MASLRSNKSTQQQLLPPIQPRASSSPHAGGSSSNYSNTPTHRTSSFWSRGLKLTPVKQRLFHHNGHHHQYHNSSSSSSSVLSVRRVTCWLTGITALTFVSGFWIMTSWLPVPPPLHSSARGSTTTTTTTTGASTMDGSSRFRQLRHDGDLHPTTSNNNKVLLRRPFGTWPEKTPGRPTTTIQPITTGQDPRLEDAIRQFLQDSDQALQQDQPLPSQPPVIQQLQNDWDGPLVHLVNTRFMQEQGRLAALGRARLYLFQTFCLPTMLQQSTQDFLWIIKTDPQLDPVLLQEFMETLRPHSHIYLVASNVNFMIRQNYSELEEEEESPGKNEEEEEATGTIRRSATQQQQHQQRHLVHHSWRDGAEIHDILSNVVYTGNMTRLYQAMVQKDRQVVLETRLDADDGLHKFYLQQIQDKALEQFVPEAVVVLDEEDPSHHAPHEKEVRAEAEEGETPPTIPKWLYWCTRRHVEWHGGVTEHIPPPSLLPGTNDAAQVLDSHQKASAARQKTVDYYGSLEVVEHSKLCITPGITVGFGIGTTSGEVPVHAHDKLLLEIYDLEPEDACGYEEASQCLELVEDFLLMAVRARTPTSAGMQQVKGTSGSEDGEVTGEHENTSHGESDTTKHQHRKHQRPKTSPKRTFLFWDLLHDDFGVIREQIKYTNQFILNHLVPIAKDNLEGQCTSDHSCKDDTKEKLLKIIDGHTKHR